MPSFADVYATAKIDLPNSEISRFKRRVGGIDTTSAGSRSGRGFARSFGAAVMKGLAIGGGIVAALGLKNLGKEVLGAAQGAQQASKVLTGLLGSAGAAADTISRIRKVSRTSPIKHQTYLKAAETLAYMGFQGGEASKILENVGKAITAAGGDDQQMNQATQAMLKMVNSGRVYADQLNQISDAGIPIFDGLAAHFGTNIENVRKMVESGQVGIEDVMAVIENAEGGVFQRMLTASDNATQTFSNQWKIAKDNIVTTLGETIIPLIEKLTPVMAKFASAAPGLITSAVNGITAAFNKLGDMRDRVAAFFRTAQGASIKTNTISRLQSIWSKLSGTFRGVWPAIKQIAASLAQASASVGVSVWGLLLAVLDSLAGVLQAVLVPALNWLAGAMQRHQGVVTALVGAYTAWRVALMAVNFGRLLVGIVRMTVALIAHGIAIIRNIAFYLHYGAIVVAQWVRMGAAAIVHGARVVAGWVMQIPAAARAAAVHVANAARMVAGWVALGVAATVHGARAAIGWTLQQGAALRAAAAHALNVARMVAGWVLLGVQSMIQAVRVAAAWVVAMGPIAWVIAAVIAVVAVIVANWSKVKAITAAVWGAVSRFVIAVWNGIKAAAAAVWNAVRNAIVVAITAVRNWLVSAWNFIRATTAAVWNGIAGFFMAVWSRIRAIVSAAVNGVRAFVSAAWNWIRSITAAVWNAIAGFFMAVWSRIRAIVMGAVIGIRNWISTAWNFIRSVTSSVWNAIAGFFIAIWNRIKAIVQGAINWVRSFITRGWNLIKSTTSSMWNSIVGFFTNAKNRIVGVVRSLVSWVTDRFNAMKNGLARIWESIRDTAGRAFGRLKEVILRPVRAVLSWINDKIIDNVNKVTKKFGLTIPRIAVPRNEGGIIEARRSSTTARFGGRFNRGGYVPGGGPDRDSVLTYLTTGEGVIKRSRMRQLGGKKAIDAINNGDFSKLAPFDWQGMKRKKKQRGPDLSAVGGVGEFLGKAVSAIGRGISSIPSQVGDWLKQGAAFALEKILTPTVKAISEVVTGPPMVRDFLWGIMDQAKKKIIEWGKGEDEKAAAADGGGGGPAVLGSLGSAGFGRVLRQGTYRVGRGGGAHGYPSQDLPSPMGTPVYTAANGIVAKVLRLATSYGHHIRINHPEGWQTLYAHLSRIGVRVGQSVRRGQKIGNVGSTGKSTGPHLHLEVLKNGMKREPRGIIPFDSGGYLPTGMSTVYNGTGAPERVLGPHDEIDLSEETLKRLAEMLARMILGGAGVVVGREAAALAHGRR